jgi:hypothetical protein
MHAFDAFDPFDASDRDLESKTYGQTPLVVRLGAEMRNESLVERVKAELGAVDDETHTTMKRGISDMFLKLSNLEICANVQLNPLQFQHNPGCPETCEHLGIRAELGRLRNSDKLSVKKIRTLIILFSQYFSNWMR